MDNLLSFSSSYALLRWLSVFLQCFLWFSLGIFFYKWLVRRKPSTAQKKKKIPQVKLPFYNIYGDVQNFPSSSAMQKLSLPPSSFFLQIIAAYALIFKKEPLFCCRIGWYTVVVLTHHKSVEELLSNNQILEKAVLYRIIHPWIGTGLLTSHGSKWKARRKMLTHSFHFDILKEFQPVIDEKSKVLVDILKETVSKDWIDIAEPISLCSLDIICETTLGVRVDAQMNSDSEYVRVVTMCSKGIMERFVTPILHPDIIFNLSPPGRRFKKHVDILHNFTRRVIEEKKEAFKSKKTHFSDAEGQESPELKTRNRKALMDLLLDIHMTNEEFTEEDIREEIDTFTFEGHDTTAMGICWALYLIGLYPEIQKKVHEELDTLFGDDREIPVTIDNLRNMQYLERESQRLYPSVPFFARRVSEDINICGYEIKKGDTVAVVNYVLHRNPEVYPNPEKFDPDRFLPENCSSRSPFAFVPFSAGPRNCIGQRFAVMEMKTVVANVFRNFHVKSLEHRDKVFAAPNLTLRTDRPLKLKFSLRECCKLRPSNELPMKSRK